VTLPELTAAAVAERFNQLFLHSERTVLVGGAEEPFYEPAAAGLPARVAFRHDYIRSALHEVAHWCVAGATRRQLPDYGYWYSPDDRDLPQQQAFFAVETKPQALEWHFCDALGIPFSPSIDNLAIEIPAPDIDGFVQRLTAQYTRLSEQGLPPRAARFRDVLTVIAALAA
jgi:elongation factor P hydroxylase